MIVLCYNAILTDDQVEPLKTLGSRRTPRKCFGFQLPFEFFIKNLSENVALEYL